MKEFNLEEAKAGKPVCTRVWLARNPNGRLFVHLHKPQKDEDGNWFDPYISYTEIPSIFFSWVDTEEPIELIPEEEADYISIEFTSEEKTDHIYNNDSIWVGYDDDMDALNVYLEDPDSNRDLSGNTHSQCYPLLFCITNKEEFRLYEYVVKSGIVRFVPREPRKKKEFEQLVVFFKEPWFKQDSNSK